jgi:hypothetical protein
VRRPHNKRVPQGAPEGLQNTRSPGPGKRRRSNLTGGPLSALGSTPAAGFRPTASYPAAGFWPTALEEGVAEDSVVVGRPVEPLDPGIELLRPDEPGLDRRLRIPSTMAVKVFLVKPSTKWGRLEST